MPDFGAPVAQNINGGGNFVSTVSGLMGLQQQQGALELQQQAIQGGAADVQAKTQAMQERQRYTQMMKSGLDDQGNDIRNANGEPDPAKILPALGRMAPYTGQQYAQALLATHTAKVSLQSAAMGLDSTQRAVFAGPIQAIATKPDDPALIDNASAIVNGWVEQHPEMAPLGANVQHFLDMIRKSPPEVRPHLASSLSALLQGGQAVQTQPSAGNIQTGGETQSGSFAPPLNGGGFTKGSAVSNQVPPGMQVVTDPTTGNLWAIDPQHPERAVQIGQGGKSGQTPPQAMGAFPPGETKETQSELQAQRTQAQQAIATVPVMHDINRSIIDQIDKGTITGSLGALAQRVQSATGYKVNPGEQATDFNVLGKMLARSSSQLAQSMGPHTNAGLQSAEAQSGTTEYDPKAIRAIASLNDALSTGVDMYQRGLEKTVTSSPNGVFAKRTFDRQWADAFNPKSGVTGPQALRFKNAVESGDTTEQSAVLREVGGKGSNGAHALVDKLKTLRALAGEQ